ncbi:DUF3303 domain-containing protein [Halochromatium glycolicum]|jgi:hypothetical protein|uniref:Uncharacterized protein n=1 Tax=Halochromatium glycolicum TaxID=85075 RepID=A0AAJ0U008_9GAMM|nr:DUF3303 family protein [Halochromatium glycolicum]MBK1702988.1 hypothetical protein [Halochromatium glycolicum]
MLYMLINRTRPGLTSEQYQELGRLAQAFYDEIPDGLTLIGDWAADDRSRTFALLETDDPTLIERIQAPFAGLVEIETIPVTAVTGWGGGG